VNLTIENGPVLAAYVNHLYRWLADQSSVVPPDMHYELLGLLLGERLDEDLIGEVEAKWARIEDRENVAVVKVGDDTLLIAEKTGEPWRLVGAHFGRFGLDPWFGEPGTRHILIVGTDARPGQTEPLYRADSIHVIGTDPQAGVGGIVGFPRDSWVQAPYGMDKITHINATADTNALLETVERVTGLEIDGYLLTGFQGFDGLVDNFGGVTVDIPFAMADSSSAAYFSAGVQKLLGLEALAFARNRHINGGDFTRSFHQGVIIQAALAAVQAGDILQLPALIQTLFDWTWTDMSIEEVFTLGATAYLIDPASVDNVVLDGRVTTRAGASVVVLDEANTDAVFADLADGSLDDE
jgi:LCP family protein required for cell wall assembly